MNASGAEYNYKIPYSEEDMPLESLNSSVKRSNLPTHKRMKLQISHLQLSDMVEPGFILKLEDIVEEIPYQRRQQAKSGFQFRYNFQKGLIVGQQTDIAVDDMVSQDGTDLLSEMISQDNDGQEFGKGIWGANQKNDHNKNTDKQHAGDNDFGAGIKTLRLNNGRLQDIFNDVGSSEEDEDEEKEKKNADNEYEDDDDDDGTNTKNYFSRRMFQNIFKNR